MIAQLLETRTSGLLERVLNFTEARHQVILENLANVSVPGYVQKDLSVADFQKSLREAVDRRRGGNCVSLEPESTATVEFASGGSSAVALRPKPVLTSPVFHDRGVRSMESLMGQLADNATVHNMAAQLLRGQYDTLGKAISLKV